ncbi:MAG: ISL3 family transposase [Deltaproteobacteria bacterium]|nr:ISL3 family transposase [Deltaproteobacteria bacterium]
MHIKTLLNHVTKFKSFVFQDPRLCRDSNKLFIHVEPRRNSEPLCSQCGYPGAVYDHLNQREFLLPPIWNIVVILLYTMRRVNCEHCGKVIVERVPWATGKSPVTKQFAAFLGSWARKLSWKDTAESFRVSWDIVADAVTWVVEWGLANRNIDNVTAIGVDEIQYHGGHNYLTLVYQIDRHCRRLLWIGKERKKKTLYAFCDFMGEQRCKAIEFVCSDMWKAYITVIADRFSNAVHVLDRFHIVGHLNKAVDNVRRSEVKKLRDAGKPAYLKKCRWVFLKKKKRLWGKPRARLRELLEMNLRTVKAYLFKEDFDHLWTYKSVTWANKFINQWTKDVMRHRSLPELKKFARMTIRKSYGFRSDKLREIALYHTLGNLPVPEITHRFV